MLVPYIAGSALAKGMEAESARAASDAPELSVSGNQFGRAAPLPLAVADEIRRISGVRSVVPHIVGEVILGKDRLALRIDWPARGAFPGLGGLGFWEGAG